MRFDARRWALSWLLAVPLMALAWPVAVELARLVGAGPLVALVLARGAAGLALRATGAAEPAPRRAGPGA